MRPKTLLAIMPHPDDESLGFGGTLAKYGVDPEVETHLITITRGQKGNLGDPKLGATRASLGQIREQELRCASKVLKVDKLTILNYEDGELPAVEEEKGIGDMIKLIRKIKPQIIISYGPDGWYGHPDHIALSHCVNQAVKQTKSVKKLYFLATKADLADTFQKQFGYIKLEGQKLSFKADSASYITTDIDCRDFTDTKFRASRCHKTQLKSIQNFETLRDIGVKSAVTHDYYHLEFSRGEFKNNETDLFAGI